MSDYAMSFLAGPSSSGFGGRSLELEANIMADTDRWKRKAWTTVCADPTYVVEWSNRELGLTITEFQGVYLTQGGDDTATTCTLAKELHIALEYIHSISPWDDVPSFFDGIYGSS
jgi:hypothetical protein